MKTDNVELVFPFFIFYVLVYLFEPTREGAPAFRRWAVPDKDVSFLGR